MNKKLFEMAQRDKRLILTLDGGGSSFRFSASRGCEMVVDLFRTSSHGEDLERCLSTIIAGFERVAACCDEQPVAISFALPGPAPTRAGIVGDLVNLPAFRGGVALGPMLEAYFGLPVFIQNDGDMFAYGESVAGLLPWVNSKLAAAGSTRRFRNLLGVTLGTGLGAGLVSDGRLIMGDNSLSGEIWQMRNKLNPEIWAEEGASIRAVRRIYGSLANIPFEETPEPKEIAEIATGILAGDRTAAEEAFRCLGEVVGDAIANALTLFDALVVVGGGLSGAGPLFLPAVVDELNSSYRSPDGLIFRRLMQTCLNLECDNGLERLVLNETKQVPVMGTGQSVPYEGRRFTGVGLSRLETSRAIAIGSYTYALQRLDSLSEAPSFA